MTFVKSRQYREFEFANYGLSIDPDYDDKDFFAFKTGTKHNKKRIGLNSNNKGRIAKKIG